MRGTREYALYLWTVLMSALFSLITELDAREVLAPSEIEGKGDSRGVQKMFGGKFVLFFHYLWGS